MPKKPLPAARQRSVLKQIDELNNMSAAQLRKRWTDLVGTDPNRLGRSYLIRRIAYRIQELSHGGLPRDTRKRLKHSVCDESTASKKQSGPNLQPGTRLLRDWRGERYEVIVQEKGFLYNGKLYRSLSAVARAITGSYWSGNRFFGISPMDRKNRRSS